jgi:hypothetical protein
LIVFDPQWLAVGGLAVAAVAAVASPLAAYAQLSQQRRLAAIERRQRRLETTYRGTVEYLIYQRDWVVGIEAFMTIDGEPSPPEPMDPKDLAAREADVAMNGSPAVLARLTEQVPLAQGFRASVRYLRSLRDSHAPGDAAEWAKVRMEMEATRKGLLDGIHETIALINAELREE